MDAIYKKGWFKLATYWVAGYVLFFILMAALMSSGANLGVGYFVIFGIHLLTMLLGFVLAILYIIHVAQNPYLDMGGKVIWIVVLMMCGPLSMLFYYQRHLTRP